MKIKLMTNLHHLTFLHWLAHAAAFSVMALGAMALFAWVKGSVWIMTPEVAVSFLFTGAALFLLQPEQPSTLRRTVGQVLALGGIGLGMGMLLGLSPFQDSPQTAVAFILTSIGLFFLSLERAVLISVAQWAAFISVMLLVTVFFGFAHQEDMFEILTGKAGMELPTATAFALVGWGIMLAKVEKGFFRIMASDAAGGVVVRRVLFLMALFPPLLGWLPILLVSGWLTHTQVESLLASVMVLIIVLIVIRLAYRLDAEERLHEQARQQASEHQNELAQRVSRNTMGEMASGIAHEINQPLAAVANYANACLRMIQSGEEAQRLREPLQAIQQQAVRASEIIRRMRALVRKQAPNKTKACMEQVIHEALLLTKANAGKLNVPLLLELDDALPDIFMDVIQIQQVIMNIVRNALEAMQDVIIQRRQVLVRSFVNPMGMVQVDILDTGLGMDTALQQRIFEAFVTTKGTQGMGIGLSLCRSIIEAHGGQLWVESEPGQGATFSFTLPPK